MWEEGENGKMRYNVKTTRERKSGERIRRKEHREKKVQEKKEEEKAEEEEKETERERVSGIWWSSVELPTERNPDRFHRGLT